MRVLYVGSGRSAALMSQVDRTGLTVCAVNNAWRLFTPEAPCQHWIRSGDFPRECRPATRVHEHEVMYKDYAASSAAVAEHLKCGTRLPEHHLGYTIFFQGLYWIMWTLRPAEILLLGFDHDYDAAKTARWESGGRPGPHNGHLKERAQPLAAWAEDFFQGCEADAFYGHGTPDPLRLGEERLRGLFTQAEAYARRLGVAVWNVSPAPSTLNTFPRRGLP